VTTFNIATGATSLSATTMQGYILPRGSRTPTTVTITASAAVAEGATTFQATASTASTVIRAGTALVFAPATAPGGVANKSFAIVSATTTLGTTAVALPIFPLRTAIAANSTASMVTGLIPIFGLQEFGLQGQSTTVDITGTDSGSATEILRIRDGREFSINIIERFADVGLGTVIKPLLFNPAFADREMWMELVFPNGECHKGATMLQNPSKPGNQNEVARISFTATIQGSSYQFIDGFTYN
jgi:hypothetical protein